MRFPNRIVLPKLRTVGLHAYLHRFVYPEKFKDSRKAPAIYQCETRSPPESLNCPNGIADKTIGHQLPNTQALTP